MVSRDVVSVAETGAAIYSVLHEPLAGTIKSTALYLKLSAHLLDLKCL